MLDASAVMEWAVRTFGRIAMNPRERAMRLLEEATELAQTQGVTFDDATIIAKRVFRGMPGEPRKEIGQVQVTLSALAENLGFDADAEGRREFDRVQTIPQAEWDRRHAAKVAIGMAQQ